MINNHSKQLGLGPMSLQSVKTQDLNQINSIQTGVILTDLVVIAGTRLGMQKKELAALFELSAPDFSVAFDTSDTRRNKIMKIQLPFALARQIALLLCETTGLAVAGPDVERNALADVMRSMSDYLRVMGRG